MKERGIIFSASSVRAILADQKTQTRRVLVNPLVRLPRRVSSEQELLNVGLGLVVGPGTYPATMNPYGAISIKYCNKTFGVKPGEFDWVCPYSKGRTHLGDYGSDRKLWTITPEDSRLWVRETAWYGPQSDRVEYDADMDESAREAAVNAGARIRPGLLMPRWASRLTLAIEEVRVERLQAISVADIQAEGVQLPVVKRADGPHALLNVPSPYDPGRPFSDWTEDDFWRAAWTHGWDAIHRGRPERQWEASPWVWVIRFRRLEVRP